MSAQMTNRILITLSSLVLLVTVAVVVLGFRSEDTRNIVERSPCQVDPSSSECQRVSRETVREKSVKDSCIPFRKVMTVAAYRKHTICAERGVDIANSAATRRGFGATGSSGPAPGGSPGPGRTDAQRERHDLLPPRSIEPAVPPSAEQPPNKPSVPVAPPVASPPVVTPPPALKLPEVSVGLGDQGACVGVGGLTVAVGSCR